MYSLLSTFITDKIISFPDSFIRLFSEMDAISAISLIVGMVLLLVEIFQPGFGVFGILGAFIVCAGIINRMINFGDFAMLFILVFIVIFLSTIGFLLMSRIARAEWLSRTPILTMGKEIVAEPIDHVKLIGKQGVVISSLNPNGKAKIEENYYDVISKDNSKIARGDEIIVSSIDGKNIFVQSLTIKTAQTSKKSSGTKTKTLDKIKVDDFVETKIITNEVSFANPEILNKKVETKNNIETKSKSSTSSTNKSKATKTTGATKSMGSKPKVVGEVTQKKTTNVRKVDKVEQISMPSTADEKVKDTPKKTVQRKTPAKSTVNSTTKTAANKTTSSAKKVSTSKNTTRTKTIDKEQD